MASSSSGRSGCFLDMPGTAFFFATKASASGIASLPPQCLMSCARACHPSFSKSYAVLSDAIWSRIMTFA